MKYEVYIERKVITFPYENLTIGLTQQFDDGETPLEAGFLLVRDKLEDWVTSEMKRVGPKKLEPRSSIDSIFDMSNEPISRRKNNF